MRAGYICRQCFEVVETEVVEPIRECEFCWGIMDGLDDVDDPNYQGDYGRPGPGAVLNINSFGTTITNGNIGSIRNIGSPQTQVRGTHFFGNTAIENYRHSTVDVRGATHDPDPDRWSPPPANRAERRAQEKKRRKRGRPES